MLEMYAVVVSPRRVTVPKEVLTPEHMSIEGLRSRAGKDHAVLAYNTTAFILYFALADNALLGYRTLDDVWEHEMNDEETMTPPTWNEDDLLVQTPLHLLSIAKWRKRLLRRRRQSFGNPGCGLKEKALPPFCAWCKRAFLLSGSEW